MSEFSNLTQILPEIIYTLEKRVPYAYALASNTRNLRIKVGDRETLVRPEPYKPSLVVGAFNGCEFYEWSTTDIHPQQVQRWIEDLSFHIPSAGTKRRFSIDPGPALEKTYRSPVVVDPEDVSLKDKVEWAVERQAALKKISPQIVNAEITYLDASSEIVFANRNKFLSQKLIRTEVYATPYVSDGQQTLYNFLSACRAQGFEMTSQVLKDDQLARLVEDTRLLLKSPRIEPGTYDVVMGPEFSGLLAHEAFGHGMETDMFLRDRARGAEYLGKQVASPLVTMFDDPTLEGEAGTFLFDDEGWLAEKTMIIDKGILKRGMTESFSATLLNLQRTANGRRESPLRKAYARMTNTYFQAGQSKPSDLIAGVESGYYLKYATNGMEDPKGWGMQLEGLWVQKISKGKLTNEVFSPVIVTGFVPDVLKSISGVGNDFEMHGSGYCGKGHKEFLKNTTGGPTLRLRARLA